MPNATLMDAPKYESRVKFRELPLQIKYSLYLTLTAGFSSLVMIFVMAWFIQRNYNLFLGDELGVSAQVVQMVRHEQNLLETWLFILFLFSIIIMFVATFYVVRKLTDPLAALRRQLSQYARGNWTHELRLQVGSEFKELELLVNQLRKNHLRESQKTPEPVYGET